MCSVANATVITCNVVKTVVSDIGSILKVVVSDISDVGTLLRLHKLDGGVQDIKLSMSFTIHFCCSMLLRCAINVH